MGFTGFSKDTLRFLSALRKNNHKKWFDAHRADYEAHYVAPAQAFISAIAPALRKLDPKITADPRVGGSLMRIFRDVRFSKDKTPYKGHLDLWFWSGEEKGWDVSGFFLRITPEELMLGAGIHAFSPALLKHYRAAVLDAKKGDALAKTVARLRRAGYEVGAETYKKTPKGIASDHPRATLLRHDGLNAAWEGKHPSELFAPGFVTFAAKHFKAVAPIHKWLADM